ncbi:MAG: O-antigen ligase family protein [Acidobacteriota bacterium]
MPGTPVHTPPDASLPSTRPGYWLHVAHLATVWGIAASNGFQALLGFWAGWYWWRLSRAGRRLGVWAAGFPVMVPLVIYIIALIVAVIFSVDRSASVGELRDILALTTLPLTLMFFRGTRDVRRAIEVLIAMCVLSAIYGLAQYYLTDYGDLHNRIKGPFSHYQTYAGVLLIGDLLLLARMVGTDAWRRGWAWGALAVINWALLASLTRGPWVAAAVTFGAYVIVRLRRYLLFYVIAAMLFLLLAPDPWLDRLRSIGDLQDASNYDRLCMVEAGLYMIGERPLCGLGPAMVEELYPLYRHPTAPRINVPHLHNSFLQLTAERGVLALGAYIWMMVAAFGWAYRRYRDEGSAGGIRADLWLGVLMALVAFNLAGLFEDNWSDGEVQRLVLFLLAVPWCLQPATREDEPERPGTGPIPPPETTR